MNLNIKVSVIIPLYNGRDYLKRCIESFVQKDNEQFEFIFVDDGSTDGSYEYFLHLRPNENFNIYRQNNKGVSSARNLGIRMAKGDFLTFVDVDDYVSKDYCKNILSFLNYNIDLIIFGYKVVDEHGRKIRESNDIEDNKITDLTLNEFIDNLNSINYYLGYPVNKVFKRSVLEKKGILFEEDEKLFEDMHFLIKYAIAADSIIYINEPLYYYVERSDSVSNKLTLTRDISAFYALNRMLNLVLDSQVYSENFTLFCVNRYYIFLVNIMKNRYDDRSNMLLFKKMILIKYRKYFFWIIKNKRIRIKQKLKYLILMFK